MKSSDFHWGSNPQLSAKIVTFCTLSCLHKPAPNKEAITLRYNFAIVFQKHFLTAAYLSSLLVVIQIPQLFFKSVVISLKPVNFVRLKYVKICSFLLFFFIYFLTYSVSSQRNKGIEMEMKAESTLESFCPSRKDYFSLHNYSYIRIGDIINNHRLLWFCFVIG